ncbi:MAG: hypothetical protein WC575_04650 [Patescibacteria group bacterium]
MQINKKLFQLYNQSVNETILLSLGITIFLAIALLMTTGFFFETAQHFYYLALSFLHGKLYLIQLPLTDSSPLSDLALFNNNYYWALGPFPAILLLPFVYLGTLIKIPFWQGYLQFFLVVGVAYFIFILSRLRQYSKQDSFFLSLAFISSVFLGAALLPSSYHFAHVITVFLLLAILIEYLTRKRYWLIGLFLSFILATRLPASFAIIFFIIQIFFDNKATKKEKINNIIQLMIFPLIMGLLLLLYNYSRFYNIFEFGYSYQILVIDAVAKAREYGIFSLVHLPGNLFYLLLSPPTPFFKDGLSHVLQFPYFKGNNWGMSIFFTSPILIYLFKFKYKDIISIALLITTLIISLPILLYYGIGYWQFGYRYSLDFLPLLFFLFIYKYNNQYGNLTKGIKILILSSALINIYLFASLLHYPL